MCVLLPGPRIWLRKYWDEETGPKLPRPPSAGDSYGRTREN